MCFNIVAFKSLKGKSHKAGTDPKLALGHPTAKRKKTGMSIYKRTFYVLLVLLPTILVLEAIGLVLWFYWWKPRHNVNPKKKFATKKKDLKKKAPVVIAKTDPKAIKPLNHKSKAKRSTVDFKVVVSGTINTATSPMSDYEHK